MDVSDVLQQIKVLYEESINTAKFGGKSYDNGLKAKEALIRSSQLINLLHNLIKSQLINHDINPDYIHPPLDMTRPEIKIEGFLKTKNQDICVVGPEGIINEQALSINVRSQLSSMQKNIDTLYERTFAESLNLHLKFPSMCLGEVYLIPTHEYDSSRMPDNEVSFKAVSKLESYIKMFQAINLRAETSGDEYKYERVALLIVDFREKTPKLYSTVQELKEAGLLPVESLVSLEGLEFSSFSNDLISIYVKRFGKGLLKPVI